MKRNIKRLPALLLAIILCLSLLPGTAWAANFPTKFYASVNYDYSSYSKSVIFGTVTQSSSGDLSYEGFGEKTDRVVYGMESAGGVIYTVEGRKLNHNVDDGFRELRMYNSNLTNYRTIGTVSTANYAIVDTAMDISGEAPALYGTYNTVIPDFIAMSMICTINLETATPGDYLQVTGLPNMHIIYAIAFDKKGTLYAIGADAGADGGPATLYTLDLKNASSGKVSATPVGEIKDSSDKKISTNWIQDLAFDHATGTLYWMENEDEVLYTLDTETAVATRVGKTPALQAFCIPYDAAFAEDRHMVSVVCEGAGTVGGNGESKTFYMVEDNGSVTLGITPNEGSGLRYVKVDGKSISTAGLVENGYTFNNVTKNHVIEVGFKLAIPATQKTVDWLHYQGEPASFYTKDNVYKFYDLPYLDKEVPRGDYFQTLLDEEGKPIDDDEIILPGSYNVHVTHPGNAEYAALDVTYEDALQLAKCPGTPGRPVVYGKVGCTQGDLTTTSALQDYYGADGKLIDAAHDEIPVTLVWLSPETTYNEAGNFSASATIHAADELEQRLKDCYNLDDEGTPLTEGCLISARNTQVIVLPADQASIIKVQASDASGGTVSGKGVYKNGETVTVTATVNSNAGYTFGGWQENGQIVSGAGETYTFEADGDRTLTALFEVSDDYRVTLQTDPADAGTVTGGGSYDEEPHSATVTATANPGYYFMGWYQGDELVTEYAERNLSVPETGITLTAKFGIDYLTRAEQAKTNFASALGTDVFEWETLVQAVDAYKAAADFVKNPPSGIIDAQNRYDALTTYYNGIQALDLSGQDIGNDDLTELYLFTGVTDLSLSGNKDITSLANLAHMTLETLNLSSTGITDLTSLGGLAALETLNLSNNKGIADLSALKGLTALEALDISGTGVTTLDSLVPEGESSFPGYQNLTAKNLTLNSISALAQLVDMEDFDANDVTKWDFTGSTLPDTEGSKTDVEAIQGKLSNEQFIPPTVRTTPDPTPVPTPAEHGVVVADCAHGKVTAEPAKAAEGATVVLTIAPEEGYELKSIEAVGADGAAVELAENADGTFSFTMPAGNVTVAATFGCDGGELCPSHGFADVDQGQWYHEAIDWAVSNKVLNGFDDTGLMMPDADLTRAQMAQILWNIKGNPAADYLVTFGDVREDDWHHDAIAWAASEGIFEGYDDGSGLFGPDDALTREQAAAVLMRWTKANGGDVTARADLSGYPDAGGVSGWAVECVQWAVAVDIVSGVEQPDGTLLLDAQGTSSRAMAATLMMRLVG